MNSPNDLSGAAAAPPGLWYFPLAKGRLSFGRRPKGTLAKALQDENLDGWWNVALELADLSREFGTLAREIWQGDLPDGGIPRDVRRFESQVTRVSAVLHAGGRVHVSCYAGRGRTSVAIMCIMHEMEGSDLNEAVRRCALASAPEGTLAPESADQWTFLETFFSRPTKA